MTNHEGVHRRAVLGLLGATTAATLTPAVPAAAGPGAGPEHAEPHGLAGRVYRPGEPGYAEHTATYNLVRAPRPGLVVAAADAGDVRIAVRHAARHHRPVAVLATGHQPSVPIGRDAILVSTRDLRRVTVDARRRVARVEAGARWQDVVDRTVPAGLAPLVGSAGSVGVVGYTLGGGLSPTLGRRYGYAADHVRRIDVVTADGRLREVTATSDPELFFGLRGGKSNFGLVTAVEFDLFPVTSYYGGSITFAGAEAGRLLHAYRRWVRTVPDEMSSSVALMRYPDADGLPPALRGKAAAVLRVAYIGDAARGAALVRPLRDLARPIADTVARQPYTAFGGIHSDPVDPLPAYERSGLLRELAAETVDTLVKLAGPDAPVPITIVEVRHLGGALARPSRAPSAVSHRDAAFSLFMAGVAGPGQAAATRAAEDAVVRGLRPWSTGGLYVNFLSADEASRDAVRHAYRPDVYRRLRALKRRVDPGNLFRLNHNIPPA
ncbi:FAD-binding oxidoreductase [Actinoplanes sp. DH11]|uniref:FAD-binding oxidoreductase n=1 Tax=Actinoplanes sp. DH11 TaxID=2857011 RepID=UPI001E3DA126|nr:FAD-binding oxidoreductase [Actinoplanes sp. DH11]